MSGVGFVFTGSAAARRLSILLLLHSLGSVFGHEIMSTALKCQLCEAMNFFLSNRGDLNQRQVQGSWAEGMRSRSWFLSRF